MTYLKSSQRHRNYQDVTSLFCGSHSYIKNSIEYNETEIDDINDLGDATYD